jgi:hypothetical protein
MKPEAPFDGIHHLITRIDVELAPIFSAASHEHQRVRMLPQNVDALAGLPEFTGSFG